jgi:hypothetical protein
VAVVATCVAVAGVSPLFSAERISGCCRLKTTKHDCVCVLSLEQIAPFIRSQSAIKTWDAIAIAQVHGN